MKINSLTMVAGRFALLGFAQTLGREGLKSNILVNVVSNQGSQSVIHIHHCFNWPFSSASLCYSSPYF
jgi:hypothetical protein